MSTVVAVLASLGGVGVIGAAVRYLVRAIAGQVNATEDNTKALQALTAQVSRIDDKVSSQGERIARLEGRP